MPKISLLTIISIFINIFLTFWLVNQYVSDVYFQNYVNNAIGQYSAFIILTIGVGGGSSLGYLFLKKRHSDGSLVSKIQKSKSFKPVAPLSTSPSTTSPVRSILPTGAPPSQVSKHTVYAVPPLPRSSSPSSSRTVPGTSWAAASKPAPVPTSSLKQETPSKPGISNISPVKEIPRPSPPGFTTPPQQVPSPPLRSIGETPPRSSAWSIPTASSEDKPAESGPIFQKPGLDTTAKQGSGFSGYSTPVKSPESSPVPSKWAPPVKGSDTSPVPSKWGSTPENKPAPGQWGSTGVSSIPPLPTKWSPPSGIGPVQDKQSPPSAIPRPGQLPPRNPMSPTPQSAPRPFGLPNPSRPGEPRPVAAPQPFRPNLPRPQIGPNPQQRPPPPMARPPAPVGGPMPQPWSPSSETTEKKEPTDSTDIEGIFSKPSLEPKTSAEPTPGGGEALDWDTALDTILKTLKKDRGVDSK